MVVDVDAAFSRAFITEVFVVVVAEVVAEVEGVDAIDGAAALDGMSDGVLFPPPFEDAVVVSTCFFFFSANLRAW